MTMTNPLTKLTRFAPGYPTLFRRFRLLLLVVGLAACGRTQPPGAGPQQRMRLTVGEIREISLPSPADTTVTLAGSSDNSEVVDVSPKQTAGAVQPTAPGTRIFLIKGVTIGTARVVFSEKRTGTAADGPARKTYLVQVVSQ